MEKQQQLQIFKIEVSLNYIIDELAPTNIILTKKNWLSYKWCRRLVEKVTVQNKYTVSLLLQIAGKKNAGKHIYLALKKYLRIV